MNRIRIQHVINSLGPDGAQQMLLKLLSRLDRRRFDCQVISLLDYAPLHRKFFEIGISVTLLDFSRQRVQMNQVLKLVRLLYRERPHLVQTWLYHADLLGGAAAKLAGNLPVVWNIRHSNLDPEVNTRTTLLTAKACAYLSSWLPAKIICCAEAARLSHVQFGYADQRFKVIPNGFDLDVLCSQMRARCEMRRELGIGDQTVVIGLVGRFHPQKDHLNFIHAAAHFVSRYADTRFILAGDDVQWENQTLVSWIQQSGITDKVILLGHRGDIPRLLSAMDISTSSSLGEGFPNSVGEAMACQIPCVVTDVGDSAELVGDTGIVVPARNPEALAEAWLQIAQLDEADRRILGVRARQRIRERFSIEAVVDSYERLYSDLFAATRPR